jgi:hypothetical protein
MGREAVQSNRGWIFASKRHIIGLHLGAKLMLKGIMIQLFAAQAKILRK